MDRHLRHTLRTRPVRIVLVILGLYLGLAYVILPRLWHMYETQFPPATPLLRTVTAIGVPGDPLNIGLYGSQPDLMQIMERAGWMRADPLTWRTGLGISRSIVFGTAYDHAPVSTLYFMGRPQDIAFEKPIPPDADRRHHVRFWQMPQTDARGQPLWYGAATMDVAVGLNHLTGQLTHHINPDIDLERDGLLADLAATGLLGRITDIAARGAVARGRNGEGDIFFSDGLLRTAPILAAPAPAP